MNRKGRGLNNTIWEQAVENIREAFIGAALDLDIDAYQAEMFLSSVREDLLASRSNDVRLKDALHRAPALTESQNDRRIDEHRFRFRQLLANSGLASGLTGIVEQMIGEELDVQTEAQLSLLVSSRVVPFVEQPQVAISA